MGSRFGRLVVMVAAMALPGCLGDENSEAHLEQSQVASVRLLTVGGQLPSSASDVWIAQSSFPDSRQLLRFDADLDEARFFARQVLGVELVRGEDPHFTSLSRVHEWWLREYPAGAEGGRRDSVERRLLIQVVLLPMERRARVWLVIAQG